LIIRIHSAATIWTGHFERSTLRVQGSSYRSSHSKGNVLELLYDEPGEQLLAKIAVELDKISARRTLSDEQGGISTGILAQGDGWSVSDVVCTAGPRDRPFEERHSDFNIAIVTLGSFQYRAAAGRELMTPGSLLLANANENFECSHEHDTGDRCLSFGYSPEYFGRLAADAGANRGPFQFHSLRLPQLHTLSAIVTRACAGLAGACVIWEELSLQLATRAVQLIRGLPDSGPRPAAALSKVTRVVRLIERHPDAQLTIADLARNAGLSPYHFLRTFEHLTGITPHRYIRRARLRLAAQRLLMEPTQVLDVAFECGFGDVSNFNHAFRAEFGVSPRMYRRQHSCSS
jgi:AraC family transcriptional regulator